MNSTRVLFFVMAVAGFVPAVCAGQAPDGSATTPTTETGHPHHPLIHFILDHAQQLNLTSDQTAELTKLENAPVHHPEGQGANAHRQGQTAGASGTSGTTGANRLNGGQPHHHELPARIKAILTPDQQTELLTLLAQRVHKHHGNHQGAAAGTQNNSTASK